MLLNQFKTPSKTKRPPDISLDLVLEFRSPFPPHPRRVDVGRRLVVGLGQHAHDTNQNLLHALDGRPAFRGVFVVIRVVAGRVEDGYADHAVGVDLPTS